MECKIKCLKKVGDDIIELTSGDLINEVDLFTVIIESNEQLTDSVLLLTDIPIDLIEFHVQNQQNSTFLYRLSDTSVKNYFINQNFEDVFDLFKNTSKSEFGYISFYKLFLNYPIGRCELKIFNDELGTSIDLMFLNITSSKIEDEEFTLLVKYIEEKGNNIWSQYSLIKHEALSSNYEDRTDWLIIFCKAFLEDLQSKYLSHFEHDKITTLQSRQNISLYNDDIEINEESIIWLSHNLDTLLLTDARNADRIIINKKNYLPYEISGNEYYNSTDNPENRLLHGFLNEIQYFFIDLLEALNIQVKDTNPIIFEDLIFFYASKRKISQIKGMITNIINLKDYFNSIIPVSIETTDFLNSNRIENKNHYYYVYKKFIEWSLNKSAEYNLKNNLFKGINRLDHLFERACLYKIIDDLTKLKYKIDIVNWSDEAIPSLIKFSKGNKENYLYFQSLPPNLVTTKRGSNNLQPDFILELHDKSIIIVDAKYKKETNISKFDIPELTLKYLHGLGNIEGRWNNFVGLLVLFPSKYSTKSYYHKHNYSLEGRTPVKPFIGSIGISFQKEENSFSDILSLLMD